MSTDRELRRAKLDLERIENAMLREHPASWSTAHVQDVRRLDVLEVFDRRRRLDAAAARDALVEAVAAQIPGAGIGVGGGLVTLPQRFGPDPVAFVARDTGLWTLHLAGTEVASDLAGDTDPLEVARWITAKTPRP